LAAAEPLAAGTPPLADRKVSAASVPNSAVRGEPAGKCDETVNSVVRTVNPVVRTVNPVVRTVNSGDGTVIYRHNAQSGRFGASEAFSGRLTSAVRPMRTGREQ
jgi:hypothetical protein